MTLLTASLGAALVAAGGTAVTAPVAAAQDRLPDRTDLPVGFQPERIATYLHFSSSARSPRARSRASTRATAAF